MDHHRFVFLSVTMQRRQNTEQRGCSEFPAAAPNPFLCDTQENDFPYIENVQLFLCIPPSACSFSLFTKSFGHHCTFCRFSVAHALTPERSEQEKLGNCGRKVIHSLNIRRQCNIIASDKYSVYAERKVDSLFSCVGAENEVRCACSINPLWLQGECCDPDDGSV